LWQSEFATFCFDPTTSKIVAVGTAILELLYVICLHETKTQGRAFKKSFVKIKKDKARPNNVARNI